MPWGPRLVPWGLMPWRPLELLRGDMGSSQALALSLLDPN